MKRIFIPLFFLAASFSMPAENVLPDEQRTNGAETLKAASVVQSRASANTVVIGESRETGPQMGVVVADDGYVLTKSREPGENKTWRVWWSDGSQAEARVVKGDEKLGVALLKVERKGLTAVSWGDSRPLSHGQWLCCLANQIKDLRIGVLSAKRRAIPNSGAVMGVRFGPSEKDDEGVIVEEVAKEGPAHKAGLRANDLLVELDGKPVNSPAAVRRVIAKRQVGDVVKLRYQREGKPGECEVRLASKNQVMMNWTGEDFANHGTSLRTDNFVEVLQHDMPLSPADMGGAPYDLKGSA
ncbi:MAG: PDZ domain-containing protein, partial [Verrucomicrobiaceae bacterium]